MFTSSGEMGDFVDDLDSSVGVDGDVGDVSRAGGEAKGSKEESRG